MKKFLLSATIACMAATNVTNAQITLGNNRMRVVPSVLTTNSKPVLTLTEEDASSQSIKFYDSNLQVTQTLNISLPSYNYKFYREIAVVEPNDSTVGSRIYGDYGEVLWGEFIKTDLSAITSSEELIAAIPQDDDFVHIYGTFLPYTDSEGRIGVIHIGDEDDIKSYFYEYDKYGTKFPLNYYAITDGKLLIYRPQYFIQYEYPIPYTLDEWGYRVYSPDNVTWSKDKDFDREEDQTCYAEMKGVDFYDYDKTGGYSSYIYLSQTLFNNDSKWEYLIPIIEECTDYATSRQYTYYDEYDNRDEKNLHFERYVTHRVRTIGYKVVSENGSTLMTFKGEHPNCTYFEIYGMYIIDGKKLIETYESYPAADGDGTENVYTLYLYDSYTNSVKTISSAKSRQQIVSISDGTINVEICDNSSDSDLILSNMAGQVVGQKHVARGETRSQLNAANLSKGVYHLTLRRQGKVLDNQKLLVK